MLNTFAYKQIFMHIYIHKQYTWSIDTHLYKGPMPTKWMIYKTLTTKRCFIISLYSKFLNHVNPSKFQ